MVRVILTLRDYEYDIHGNDLLDSSIMELIESELCLADLLDYMEIEVVE